MTLTKLVSTQHKSNNYYHFLKLFKTQVGAQGDEGHT